MTQAQPAELSKKKRLQVLIAVAIGTFMAPLDSSVVNIALPSIKSYFNATFSTAEWVIMSYLLVISSLLLTYGRMGDMFGHKRIYVTGLGIFTVGSILCGISPTILALIFFRALQAIGAGMMMSMGPAIITNISSPQNRGKALGLIAVSVSVALSLGPILGGFLTSYFGWQSIFYINIPIGLISVYLAQKAIPNFSGHDNAAKFDIYGALILFLSLISILAALSFTERVGWRNPYLLITLATGIILLFIFVAFEKRLSHPMIDLSLFKNRLFSMSNISALLNYLAMFTVVFIMPFYLQQLRNMSPSEAGILLIPMPLTTMLIAPLSGALSDKIDSRYISSLGMAITAVALALLSTLDADTSKLTVMFYLAIMGLGSGIFQTPNNNAIMGSVPPNRRGIASSMLASMRNMGMVLGVAVSGAVFSNYLKYSQALLTSQGVTGITLQIQSFTSALHVTYMLGAAIAIIAIITSLIRGPQQISNKS